MATWIPPSARDLTRAVAPIGGGAIVLLLAVAWMAWASCGFRGCPNPADLTAYQPGQAPVLLDRSGVAFAELHPWSMRVTPLDSLPPSLPAAFVAVEDRRFFRHRGVDWPRVFGAARANFSAGEVREGASTITMQLARTLFSDRIPGTDRTFRRKLVEARVAGRIEGRFTKQEILELYLNHVYVGEGDYGVEAGARQYFGLSASELAPEQSALLAAVVRAPAYYDPRRNPEAALARRNLVLTLMEDSGQLEESEAEAARASPLGVTPEARSAEHGLPAPYFVETVRSFLEEELGDEAFRSPVRVHTTLDLTLQVAAEEELVRQLRTVDRGEEEELQGAVVFLNPENGDVLALVGGRDFRASSFNRATLARRQMGSAFKPFVYAAALERGYVASQPLADEPFTLEEDGSPDWSPRNYDDDFHGAVSMRRALVESLNIPTVRLAMAVGMKEVARTAAALGISEPVPELPAAALGTTTASPLELASAYGVLARNGVQAPHRFVTLVETASGRVLHEPAFEDREVMDARVAYVVSDILVDAVREGTGAGARAAGYSERVAGKTGTTQDAHDAWFVGYTPNLVGLVWIGFDQPRPIRSGATGGGLAAPVWGRIMSRAAGTIDASESWPRPPGIVERAVDPSTGKVMEAGCATRFGGTVDELFLEEYLPVEDCPRPRGLLSRFGDFLRSFGDPESEPVRTARPGDEILGADRVPLAEDEAEGGD